MPRPFLAAAVVVGGAVLAGIAGLALLWWDLERYAARALPTPGQVFELPPGHTLAQAAADLAAEGVVETPCQLVLLARLRGVGDALKAAEYQIPPHPTPDALLALLQSGRPVEYRFTIVEGWTLAELRAALAAEPRLVQRTADLSEAQLMRALGSDLDSGEGWFLPETYRFPRGSSDLALLRRAHRAMQDTLATLWAGRAGGLPLTSPKDALILASIVEKETGRRSEQGQVAGVFVNRLHRGMRLQTDPTIIYGLGKAFDGNLTRAHLRADGPYNTYTRHGLPPTPIALPGRQAIEAVMHPEPTEALYFVAKGDGTHAFSRSLAEHNRAVARYQLGRP